MHFPFLTKVAVNETLQIPQQGPYRERRLFTRPFFYIYLKFLIKISLNKEKFSFSQRL